MDTEHVQLPLSASAAQTDPQEEFSPRLAMLREARRSKEAPRIGPSLSASTLACLYLWVITLFGWFCTDF